MFSFIVKKELLVSIKSLRFVVALLICCLLIPLSVMILGSDQRTDIEDYKFSLKQEERGDIGMKPFEVNVYKPVPALQSLFSGVSRETINAAGLGWGFGDDRFMESHGSSPILELFPAPDITFIVGTILALLALMMAYDGFCGEKENATLRLIVSNSVARSSLLLGKWVGISLALLIPFSLGIVISLIVWLNVTGVSLGASDWFALAANIFLSVIYLSLFILIGLIISLLTRSSLVSVIVSLGVWGLLTLVIPGCLPSLGSTLQPAPTPQEYQRQVRLIMNEEKETESRVHTELARKVREEQLTYAQGNPLRLKAHFEAKVRMESRLRDLINDYRLKLGRQEELVGFLEIFSPFGAFAQATFIMADTGPESQRAFLQQVMDFQWRYFPPMYEDFSDYPGEEDVKAAPKFEYRPLPLEQRFLIALPSIAALVVEILVLLIIGAILVNRYDVR